MNIEKIKKDLENKLSFSKIILQEDMKKHTSFKIGGKADIFIEAENLNDIIYIIKYTKENEIPVTVIGNGSNLLVKDNGIRGIVLSIATSNFLIRESEENIEVEADAGVKLGFLGGILLQQEIEGFEFAAGIPGTIGGAIRMNAGAFGKEFKDIVKQVTYIDENGEIHTIEGTNSQFSYRHSRFIESKEIIISCVLKLKKGNKQEIQEKMLSYANTRKEKQPLEMPSAGSTFKRGTNFITAQLIDEAGLKGYTIGGAQVSTKHAGFVVNTGNATAEDVLKLTEHITKVIYEKFGKVVELEVEIVGE